MISAYWTFFFSSSLFLVLEALLVQDLPACAQQCLGNSTSAQLTCPVIDIKCLCSTSAYVSAVSCCLYQHCDSDEQALAIQFNQQECEAVNETAPNFVGCSPAGLSSALSSASAEQAATRGSGSLAPFNPATSSASISGVLTITGDVVKDNAPTQTGRRTTANFEGRPLMTGSCVVPYFAIATNPGGAVIEYPAVGCSDGRKDCCPFDPAEDAVLTRCPQDHFTTAGGCCPIGYQVWYTAVGAQTPCYSDLVTKYLPVSSPSIPDLSLITDHVFAQRYDLALPRAKDEGLSTGAIVGIAVGSTVGAILVAGLLLCYWRRRSSKTKAAKVQSTTFPPNEPALHQISRVPTTHELDSPATAPRSAGVASSNWPISIPTSPPAYEGGKSRPLSNKSPIPQELPGSTFIHEHHPAFTATGEVEMSGDAAPSTPPKTPTQSAIDSERRSPPLSALGASTPRTGAQSPGFISPLSSPKFPQHR
ncbi:hypothetical protein PV10_01878 [Exophiala mesophila]|uniref:CFEM domain-containing protein n=1 Tax=Exophiala mesophila TaxID=212818 RepID=A0A0D1YBY8_EXOME|nr:uncharacterized protein PV10_01878 [Exophiala mesophila]KIV98201.1 hypothetical protein PV10_01878 [Exophiala mesophila]